MTDVSSALRSCFSVRYGLPVSERSAAACEEKKICWGGFCCVVCVLVCVSRGALADFFLTSSSRDMTATVLSNAALEKKKVSKGKETTGMYNGPLNK